MVKIRKNTFINVSFKTKEKYNDKHSYIKKNEREVTHDTDNIDYDIKK